MTAELSNIITFDIMGVSCQAESGMRWMERCDSEYNTSGLETDGVHGYTIDGRMIDGATAFDTIIAGESYNLIGY